MKKTNHSKKKEKLSTIDTPTFYSMRDMAVKPVTDNYLRNLAINTVKLVEEDEDIITMTRVFNLAGVLKKQWYRWAERHEDVKNATIWIRQIIGDRRESGALKRKLDSATVLQMMPYYDEDWKAINEWRSRIKHENAAANEAKVVVIERFPEQEK